MDHADTMPEPTGDGILHAMEDLIERILAQRKDLTREKIQSLIEEKKREAQDLLSEQGAARLVAEELLVETEPTAAPSIVIQKIVSGLNDVTIRAKVVTVEPLKSFVRQDGSTGRVLRLVLADETGKIGCSMWDDKADQILKHGDLTGSSITIRHGYTRVGLTGEVELSAGGRSEITVNPELAVQTAKITPIGNIKEPAIELDLLGVTHSIPRLYQFDRNGQQGAVLRTILADTTGSVSLVAWNEKAEELRHLKRGDVLKIQNGRLRRDNFGRLEIHLETRARITLLKELPEGFQIPEIRFQKIAELKSELPTANLVARIVAVGDTQQVQRKSGETVPVSRILVGDETAIVPVSLWDDKAALTLQLRVGDIVRIEDARPTLTLGQISLSAGRTTNIQRVEDTGSPIDVKINNIREVRADSGLISLEGEVTAQPETREVTTAKGEKIQVTSTRVRDDTGEARVSFWRSHAIEAGKLQTGAKIRVYGLLPRPGLAEELEFNTIQASKLEVLTHPQSERPSSNDFRQFNSLKENDEVWVNAIVLDPGEDAALTSVCAECGEPVVPADDHFVCSTHGTQPQAAWRLTVSMRLDDGTDTIVAKVRTAEPQNLVGKNLSWAQKEILAKRTSTVALPIDATGKLAGMRMEAFGVTKRDPQTGKLILHTEKLFLRE